MTGNPAGAAVAAAVTVIGSEAVIAGGAVTVAGAAVSAVGAAATGTEANEDTGDSRGSPVRVLPAISTISAPTDTERLKTLERQKAEEDGHVQALEEKQTDDGHEAAGDHRKPE